MIGRWRVVLPLTALTITAAVAGIYDATSSGDRSSPAVIRLLSEEAGASVVGPAGDALGQIQPGDPAIQYPSALADLSFSPTHVAVHQQTGDVWFVQFTYSSENILHRYSSLSDTLESFAIPASKGSELYSAIEVDARGHIISAEGFAIVDFDPSSETYKVHQLPQQSPLENEFIGEGQFIADMALADASVYVSRLDVGGITQLDLVSGEIREIPLPKDFGQANDIAVLGESLWIAHTSDIDGGPPAQMGMLDLSTDAFSFVGGRATAIDANRGNVYAVTQDPQPMLSRVELGGLSGVQSGDATASLASSLAGGRSVI